MVQEEVLVLKARRAVRVTQVPMESQVLVEHLVQLEREEPRAMLELKVLPAEREKLVFRAPTEKAVLVEKVDKKAPRAERVIQESEAIREIEARWEIPEPLEQRDLRVIPEKKEQEDFVDQRDRGV